MDTLSTPNNAEKCKSWKYTLLLDPVLAATWEAFYSNENGVRTAFLQVWEVLAGNTCITESDPLHKYSKAV